jgi:SAM-dependent methyltransferase
LTEPRRAKPRHLAPEFAVQFGDEEVAAAYRHRPPYPPEAFAIVEALLGSRPRCVLELGAGTGDFTIGLATHVDTLIAVEPSRPMLARALNRDGAVAPHVEWLAMAAEDYAFERRYSAVVAAEAFHWLDWYKVMPRISESLVPGGRLILVDRSLAEPLPWDRGLRELIREFSTNRDYVPYDTAIELEVRGLITVEGRAQTETMAYRQPIEDYVESFHSRNGFSRARLQTRRAQEFDDKLKALLGQYCREDILCLPVQTCIVWGRPIAS